MSAPKLPSILLIGCGKMGGSLLDAWLKKNVIQSALVIEPFDIPAHLGNQPAVTHLRTPPAELPDVIDIVILATKPQSMDEACHSLGAIVHKNSLILSIAAGKTLAYFNKFFDPAQPIVRAMPNTPASIGQGVTALCGNQFLSTHHKNNASLLMEAGGKIVWLENEHLMDAVTALSGSGPAYVFLLIELLAKAGIALGLPPETAMILARQTVIGAGALAADQDNLTASTLRENVTSPGGTTEAALKILMDGSLEDLLTKALAAARNRGQALS
jgi:pyrroline-5-carboxylate reductase